MLLVMLLLLNTFSFWPPLPKFLQFSAPSRLDTLPTLTLCIPRHAAGLRPAEADGRHQSGAGEGAGKQVLSREHGGSLEYLVFSRSTLQEPCHQLGAGPAG